MIGIFMDSVILPKATIIIPARNAAATLAACLTACQEQEGLGRSFYEIIVVDDGSVDETAVVAKRAGADKVIQHQQPRGAGSARNSGLQAAQGEIVLFTDADCQPTRTWLDAMLQPFADPELMGGKGIYATAQNKLVARFVQLEYEDKYDKLRPQPTIDFVDTYSAAYRRNVLLENGGFDPRVFYVEDQELSFRLAAQNCKMIFIPEAVVYHLHSSSLYGYARKKFFIGYWKAQIMRLYPERMVRDSHTPQILKVQMGMVALVFALLFAGLFVHELLIASVGLLVIFFLTTVPFGIKAWPKDRVAALASPFLLWVRAAALGLGYAAGMLIREVK